MGQVERRTDRYEGGLAVEDRCVGQICFSDGTRMTYESDILAPDVPDSTIQIKGSSGTIDVDLDSAVTVTDGTGMRTYEPDPAFRGLYDLYFGAHVAWLDGEQNEHRCAAVKGHSVVEIMMGIYESARTRGVAEAPIRTRQTRWP